MRKIQNTLITLVFFASLGNCQDVEPVDELKDEISFGVASTFGEVARKELSETEMDQSDVDRIVQEFSDNSADCFVGALIQQAEEQSLDADKILDTLADAFRDKSGTDITNVLDEKGLEHKLEYCIGIAFENAGVRVK